jgi:hypothetical protein
MQSMGWTAENEFSCENYYIIFLIVLIKLKEILLKNLIRNFYKQLLVYLIYNHVTAAQRK